MAGTHVVGARYRSLGTLAVSAGLHVLGAHLIGLWHVLHRSYGISFGSPSTWFLTIASDIPPDGFVALHLRHLKT